MTPTDHSIHVPVCSSVVLVPVATMDVELLTVHSQSPSCGSQVQERSISDHTKNTHIHCQQQTGAESSPLSPNLPTIQHFAPFPSPSSFSPSTPSRALLPKAIEQLSNPRVSSQLQNRGSERYQQEPESFCADSSTSSQDFSNPACLSSIDAVETEQLWELVMSTKMSATFKIMLDDEDYHHSVLRPRCFEWHSAVKGIGACKTCATIYDLLLGNKAQFLSPSLEPRGPTESHSTESNSLESNIFEEVPAKFKAQESMAVKSNTLTATHVASFIQNSVADVNYEHLALSLLKIKDNLSVVCQTLGDMLFVEFRRLWECDSCEYRVKRQNMVENIVSAKLPPVLRQATPPRSVSNSAIEPWGKSHNRLQQSSIGKNGSARALLVPSSSTKSQGKLQSGHLSKQPLRLGSSFQAQNSIYTGETNVTAPDLIIPKDFWCDLAYYVNIKAVEDMDAHFALTRRDPYCMTDLTAPYFAVVFDERESSDTITEKNSVLYTRNKLMSVGLVYLYNRYLLRYESLMENKSSELAQEFEKDILFFGITVSRGLHFSVFAIEPKLSDLKWQGCTMHELENGVLVRAFDLKFLSGLVRGIQTWAVVHYIEGLKKDAERL